ncbi:hypothetical protein [Sphingomonas sp.]|uniref:hypothetical protein n=1 Tax=Sphingomonas sp. TaxID=28214 RepID=UPI002ED7C8A4
MGSVEERKNPGSQAATIEQETTMPSPYLTMAQNWCFALRTLMNYPPYAPPFHTTAWCSSTPRNIFEAMELTKIAAAKGTDLIHVAFTLDTNEPLGVSLAIRESECVVWIPNVRLYAPDEAAPIQLLADDCRWLIGPRLFLTSAKLPPKHRRAKGEEIAWRRWRHAAATIAPLGVEGSVWVPPGGTFKDAIPHERLNIAA